MSDYLSRLAARLTAREPAIVPRARSRFEPDAPESIEFFEAFEHEESARPRPARLVTAAPRTPPPLEPYAPPPTATTFGPSLPPSPGSIDPSLPIAAEPIAVESSRRDRPAVDDALGPAAGSTRSTHEMPPALVELEPRASRVVPATPEPRAPARTGVAAGHVRAATTATARPSPPSPVTSRRSVRTAQHLPSAPSSGTEPEPPGTTVDIAIGRIEIRPPAEPPTASKPTRRAPELSLERYLEQRRGGRR